MRRIGRRFRPVRVGKDLQAGAVRCLGRGRRVTAATLLGKDLQAGAVRCLGRGRRVTAERQSGEGKTVGLWGACPPSWAKICRAVGSFAGAGGPKLVNEVG